MQNPDSLPKADRAFCEQHISFVLGGVTFRDHDDSEIYLANVIDGVLTEYPCEVVAYVCSPRTGIQNSTKRLPGNLEFRNACNARMDALRREYEAAMLPQRLQKKAEEEAQLAAEKAKHLSANELKAKYGINGHWLPPVHDPVREAAKLRSEERNDGWNRKYIEREYAMHGYRPYERNGVPITLSLALQMQALGKITLERL